MQVFSSLSRVALDAELCIRLRPFMHASTSSTDLSPVTPDQDSSIVGIDSPVILNYFETINSGEFQVTGELFADDGALQPPFEQAIVGPAAIVDYLQREARGFVLQPSKGSVQTLEDSCQEVQVFGNVQTPLFSVNVSWQFILSPQQQIQFVKIKLLAALQELLNLRQRQDGSTPQEAIPDPTPPVLDVSEN